MMMWGCWQSCCNCYYLFSNNIIDDDAVVMITAGKESGAITIIAST